MPSVTDLQQQSSKMSSINNGTITPPPQQQPISSTSTGGASGNSTTIDPSNADPLTQALLMLEKKQRNLGKRKEKLESYEQEAKTGKELNKDQKDALSKYGEVIGQIECAKDIHEQLKKMQADLAKSQKRTLKQAAEERRTQHAQRLREFAQVRYLIDHRPSSLKSEESSLLDDLARIVIPSDLSTNTLTRCVDTILSIYQVGPSSSTIKGITGRSAQEVRETIEQLIKTLESPSSASMSSLDTPTTLANEPIKQTPVMPQVPPPTPASVLPERKQPTNNDVVAPSLTHAPTTDINQVGQTPPPLPHLSHPTEYPVQFDTRNQNVPLQQIMQDHPYFFPDNNNNNSGNPNSQVLQDTSNNQQQSMGVNDETTVAQSPDPKQYLQTFTVVNSSMATQPAPQGYAPPSAAPSQNSYNQEISSAVPVSNDDQQQQSSEEQWQHRRGTGGGAHRGSGQYNNGAGQRGQHNRSGHNQYQQWRGPRGGGGGGNYFEGGPRQQHPYNENSARGGSGQRTGPNPHFRGNRGGAYRGNNRGGGGYNLGADNYQQHQKSSHYQQNNGQQVRSAPPPSQQQQ